MKLDVAVRFPGTCEDAFRFYQSVFGGELTMLQRYKEMREHGYEVATEDEEKIAFVMLPVNEQFLLPGDDVLPSAGECVQGNNFLLGVSVDSRRPRTNAGRIMLEGPHAAARNHWNAHRG